MAPRVTYRRHNSYNTSSNKVRKTRTPGGRLAVLHLKKKTKAPTCGEAGCDVRLGGLKRVRPSDWKNLKKRERTVSRAYGGVLCA
jgi:large subunit ribosomal protein L34e